jgi:hypothetical protein
VGAAIGAIGAIIGIILSPIGLIIAAVVALYLAFQNNFLGIRDILQPILDGVLNYIQTVIIPGLQAFWGVLQGAWALIQPELQKLYDWFMTTGLPAIQDFITNTVVPGVQKFIDLLTGIWNAVSPVLTDLFNWFITDGLPKIVTALTDFKTNAIDPVINLLTTIWDIISPALQKVYDWFMTNGLPAIQSALQWFSDHVVKPAVDLITSLIDIAGKVTGTVANTINSAIGGNSTGGNFVNSGAGAFPAGGSSAASPALQAWLAAHPSGDFTGIHNSGISYLVGRGAQPQLFTPKSDMMGIPNIDKLMGGGGDTFHVSIMLPDSAISNPGAAREAGRVAADSFEQRILDKKRSRA